MLMVESKLKVFLFCVFRSGRKCICAQRLVVIWWYILLFASCNCFVLICWCDIRNSGLQGMFTTMMLISGYITTPLVVQALKKCRVRWLPTQSEGISRPAKSIQCLSPRLQMARKNSCYFLTLELPLPRVSIILRGNNMNLRFGK